MTTGTLGIRLLETLTSALYEDPIVLFREYVQNSVDACIDSERNGKSLRAQFNIDINIDEEKKFISFFDNGYGIEEDKFINAMTSIGASEKDKHYDQIGFRGIGRLSAMPFCKKLIFKNKPKGLDKVLTYTWSGDDFDKILNQDEEPGLFQAISKISAAGHEDYSEDKDDHFFLVEVHSYNEEISSLIKHPDFERRLQMMLPLRYHPGFKKKKDIEKAYLNFMGESLEKYSYAINLNSAPLYKPYTNKHILESDVFFWELRFPNREKGVPGEKVGLLWFTFQRKLVANDKSDPYGVLVRSKNMLVGDQNSLVNALFRTRSDDYIGTYRELTQTLQGVFGEMLILNTSLKDNARRDWFKIDTPSLQLRDIIHEFVKHLVKYRKVASKAFNAIENDKNRSSLVAAFTALTSNYKPKDFIDAFYRDKHEAEVAKDSEPLEFADEDIPGSPVTIRRFYERILSFIREYFVEQENLQEFIKMRTHLKKQMNPGKEE